MSLTAVKDIEHGTTRGFDAHQYRGEEACTECKAAHATRTACRRIRNGKQQAVRVSVVELGELLINSSEETLHQFGELFGHEITAACMDIAAEAAWARKQPA